MTDRGKLFPDAARRLLSPILFSFACIAMLVARTAAQVPVVMISKAPVIAPQGDGVVYMNADAAAPILWSDNLPHLIDDGSGQLTRVNGAFITWDGEKERPYWRIHIPDGGRYEVVITHATATGRESAATIFFWNLNGGHQGVTGTIPSTGGWDITSPLEMGEVGLSPGDYEVEYCPTDWTSNLYLITLRDIRLIPIDKAASLSIIASPLLVKLGISSDRDVIALTAKAKAAHDLADGANHIIHSIVFGKVSDYDDFLKYDDAKSNLRQWQAQAQDLDGQVLKLEAKKLQEVQADDPAISSADRDLLARYLGAEQTVTDGPTRDYLDVYYAGLAPNQDVSKQKSSIRTPLFPVGNLNDLPKQPFSADAPTIVIPVVPAPDASERTARFEARNSDSGLQMLCTQLHSVVHTDAPGLQPFDADFEAGRYRQALDDYRAYFFDKLENLEKYGATKSALLDNNNVNDGKGGLLGFPSEFAAQQAMNGVLIGILDGQQFSANVGAPGSVDWAPSNLDPPTGTDTDRNGPYWYTQLGKITKVYQGLDGFYGCDRANTKAGFFNALIFSYVVNGDTSRLDRWCQYLDDFCMNAKTDEDNCAAEVRTATDQEAIVPRQVLVLFRIILDERPQFATDMSSATLARCIMMLVKENVPYTIRARRAEMANWGIMGLSHMLYDASLLSEFKAMDYVRQEAWRGWNINMIQHRTLDGENIEAWDTGHDGVDLMCFGAIRDARLPGWVTPLDLTDFWDQIEVNERSLLTHIDPNGNYWPIDSAQVDLLHNDVTQRWLKNNWLDLISNEAGAKQRVDTILAKGSPPTGDIPNQNSDLAPYAQMSYLREGWHPTDEQFTFCNFGTRSQELADPSRTAAILSKDGQIILNIHSLAVDNKPENHFYKSIHTGGKTDWCGVADQNVIPNRFLTSADFDVSEGNQTSPYAYSRLPQRVNPYGLYRTTPDRTEDPAPINDVSDNRQVFSVHGEGLYFIADRIANRSGTAHQFTQFYLLPVRLPEEGLADRVRVLSAMQYPLVEENASSHCFRTANPGISNVSIYCFGNNPFDFANVIDSGGNNQSLKDSVLQSLEKALTKPATYTQIMNVCGHRPESISWTGSGNQAFVATLYTRPPNRDIAHPFASDLSSIAQTTGPAGVVGCSGVTRTGTRFWFQTGPVQNNALICGSIKAQAESLLVIKKSSRETGGVVLGCTGIRINNSPTKCPAADFEFEVTSSGALNVLHRIYRPIDTTVISPRQDVFTDSTQVSFDIPTQDTHDLEFRYTLDGTDPTINSSLYTGPFSLNQTTLVKVRPFRKGVTETPWEDNNTDSGRTISAIFRKVIPNPATAISDTAPGLKYSYFEGDWPSLFTYAGVPGVLTPRTTGTVSSLLGKADLESVRQTDRAFAVRYEGYVDIPNTGVYTLYAPDPLYRGTKDAGFDLRVFIDGTEWFPSPHLHAEYEWSVALAGGKHTLTVSYVDYRWKTFKNEYWMSWQPEEMWQGVPQLDISGPNDARQPIPTAWLSHSN